MTCFPSGGPTSTTLGSDQGAVRCIVVYSGNLFLRNGRDYWIAGLALEVSNAACSGLRQCGWSSPPMVVTNSQDAGIVSGVVLVEIRLLFKLGVEDIPEGVVFIRELFASITSEVFGYVIWLQLYGENTCCACTADRFRQ